MLVESIPRASLWYHPAIVRTIVRTHGALGPELTAPLFWRPLAGYAFENHPEWEECVPVSDIAELLASRGDADELWWLVPLGSALYVNPPVVRRGSRPAPLQPTPPVYRPGGASTSLARVTLKPPAGVRLLDRFRALAGSDGAGLREEILSFANQYGHLGVGVPLDGWVGPGTPEPLWRWQREIAAVIDLVTLIEDARRLTKTSSERERRKILARRWEPAESAWEQSLERLIQFGNRSSIPIDFKVIHDNAALGSAALDAATWYVEHRLRGQIGVRVRPAGDLAYQPVNLLSAILLEVALGLANRQQRTSRCAHCRRPIVVTGRRRYCSERCRSNAHYRRKTSRT